MTLLLEVKNTRNNIFKMICDERTDGWTNGQMERQSDGPTDRRIEKWLVGSRSTQLKKHLTRVWKYLYVVWLAWLGLELRIINRSKWNDLSITLLMLSTWKHFSMKLNITFLASAVAKAVITTPLFVNEWTNSNWQIDMVANIVAFSRMPGQSQPKSKGTQWPKITTYQVKLPISTAAHPNDPFPPSQ